MQRLEVSGTVRPIYGSLGVRRLTYLIRMAECVGPVAQSVQRLTTGWTVLDRIPVGTRFSARPDRPRGPPSLLEN